MLVVLLAKITSQAHQFTSLGLAPGPAQVSEGPSAGVRRIETEGRVSQNLVWHSLLHGSLQVHAE